MTDSLKEIKDFISIGGGEIYSSAGKGGVSTFFNITITKDFEPYLKKGDVYQAVTWYYKAKMAHFFKLEASYRAGLPTHIVSFKFDKDKKAAHPLESVFADVLDQVTKGKGSERHGETEGGRGLTFSEQPIMTITRYVGNGYPLGQAMKKLSEVPALMKHKGRDAAYQEILGAIAYAAAAALYIKED